MKFGAWLHASRTARVAALTDSGVPWQICPAGYIAKNQTVRRNEREHLGKINCVAEVEGGSSGGYNGVGHQKHVVAAVVVDHNEIVGLNAFNDTFDIGRGKLSCQRRPVRGSAITTPFAPTAL